MDKKENKSRARRKDCFEIADELLKKDGYLSEEETRSIKKRVRLLRIGLLVFMVATVLNFAFVAVTEFTDWADKNKTAATVFAVVGLTAMLIYAAINIVNYIRLKRFLSRISDDGRLAATNEIDDNALSENQEDGNL